MFILFYFVQQGNNLGSPVPHSPGDEPLAHSPGGAAGIISSIASPTSSSTDHLVSSAPPTCSTLTCGPIGGIAIHVTTGGGGPNTSHVVTSCGVVDSPKVNTSSQGGGGGATSVVHNCPTCSYSTSRTDSMEIHLRTHSGEKPFACPYCQYRTARKWSLSVHLKTHTGEKPFHCPSCPYRAARKDVLNAHLKTHTQLKREADDSVDC